MKTIKFEQIRLKTSDGIKIAVNHFRRNKNCVLIIANGWTMSKDSRFTDEMATFFSKSFDVIAFDFRGHGESSGGYTFTKNEPEDLRCVVDYAKKHYEKIYLIGFSLGGAISIIHSASEQNLARLVIVSAPHSFEKIDNLMWVKDFLTNPFKKYERRICLTLRPWFSLKKMIKPIDVVDKIKSPTLFIAGDSDTIIHPEDTKSLYEKATCEKEFELFTDCHHAEDFIYQACDKFINTCTNWLLA